MSSPNDGINHLVKQFLQFPDYQPFDFDCVDLFLHPISYQQLSVVSFKHDHHLSLP